jgi:DNA-binding protein HU-beta
MSRQNKVNPGMYTQRGRLTQDDAAREMAKQRAIGSQNTWQPVQRDATPEFTAEPDNVDNDQEAREEPPAAIEKEPARAKAARPAAAKRAKPAPKSAKPASRRPAKTAARKAPPAKKAKSAAKRGATKNTTARAAKAKAKSAKRRKS